MVKLSNQRTILPLAIIALLTMSACKDDKCPPDRDREGVDLTLLRNNNATHRATFCYAADCRLIAAQMSSAERSGWICR